MNPKTREHQRTNTMKILERDELTRTSKDDLPGEKKRYQMKWRGSIKWLRAEILKVPQIS